MNCVSVRLALMHSAAGLRCWWAFNELLMWPDYRATNYAGHWCEKIPSLHRKVFWRPTVVTADKLTPTDKLTPMGVSLSDARLSQSHRVSTFDAYLEWSSSFKWWSRLTGGRVDHLLGYKDDCDIPNTWITPALMVHFALTVRLPLNEWCVCPKTSRQKNSRGWHPLYLKQCTHFSVLCSEAPLG